MRNRSSVIFNPIFIFATATLALNDHVLKYQFGNWFTGKLSDFAGLIVLPIFIYYLAPRLKDSAIFLSVALFIWWNSPLSEGFIQLINSLGIFTLKRVVDYTDLLALLVLPIPYYLIYGNSEIHILRGRLSLAAHVLAIFSTSLILCSTSMGPCYVPEGTVYIGQDHTLKVPIDTVLSRINQLGYDWEYIPDDYDTMGVHYEDSIGDIAHIGKYGHYEIRDILVPIDERTYCGTVDTIKTLRFSFFGVRSLPKIRVIDVTFSDTLHISDWRSLRKYSRMYRKKTKDLFVKESIRNKQKLVEYF